MPSAGTWAPGVRDVAVRESWTLVLDAGSPWERSGSGRAGAPAAAGHSTRVGGNREGAALRNAVNPAGPWFRTPGARWQSGGPRSARFWENPTKPRESIPAPDVAADLRRHGWVFCPRLPASATVPPNDHRRRSAPSTPWDLNSLSLGLEPPVDAGQNFDRHESSDRRLPDTSSTRARGRVPTEAARTLVDAQLTTPSFGAVEFRPPVRGPRTVYDRDALALIAVPALAGGPAPARAGHHRTAFNRTSWPATTTRPARPRRPGRAGRSAIRCSTASR